MDQVYLALSRADLGVVLEALQAMPLGRSFNAFMAIQRQVAEAEMKLRAEQASQASQPVANANGAAAVE